MADNILNNIERSLGEITGELKGINKRLDISNSNIAKNQDRINKLESFKDNLTGRITIIVIIAGTAVSIAGSLLTTLIKQFTG